MSPVPPVNPQLTNRALDTVEWWAKFAGAILVLWGFAVKVGKPVVQWRQKRFAELTRAALHVELTRLETFSENVEKLLANHSAVLTQQEETYMELDQLIGIAHDNRERLDEINDLLDEVGLTSRDRRKNEAEQAKLSTLMEGLMDRRRARRRNLPNLTEQLT